MEHSFHRELKRQAADYFCDNGWQTFQEFVLPDKHIADIFAYCPNRGYVICEVATLYTASKAANAFGKYRPWCNRLYLAAPGTYDVELGEGRQVIKWLQEHERVGILALNTKRINVIREPVSVYLHPRATQLLQQRISLTLNLVTSQTQAQEGERTEP